MNDNDIYPYTVQNGIITSPGKFEGEAAYMPEAYEVYLDGFGLELEGECEGIFKVEITWNGEKKVVYFFEDNVGFVHEVNEEDVLATQEGHADD